MKNLNEYIDHTLLRPDAAEHEIRRVCREAVEYRFKTVCLEARWLPVAVEELRGTPVLPITVISFPKGDDPTAKKAEATSEAVKAGAKEIDMVLNRALLQKRRHRELLEDIRAVVAASDGVPVKVILETSELTDPEKLMACALAKAAGAAFVKTSTGFSKSGATESDVRLMRAAVGEEMGVKASGGVRTRADAEKMIAAGANRLGTSASIAIVKGETSGQGTY